MVIRQFIANKKGELYFLDSPPLVGPVGLAAFLIGETLIVSPSVERVECSFKGQLGYNHNLVKGKFVKECPSYKAVAFTSSVTIRLSYLLKSQVEMMVFLEDVTELIEDVRLVKKNMPVIGYIGHWSWKIEEFCKKNGLPCIDVNLVNCGDLNDMKGKWKLWKKKMGRR